MDAHFEIAEHVRSSTGEEGTVLLDLRSGKYFALNAVGSLVWESLAEGSSRDDLVQTLADHFSEVPVSRLERDVDGLLSQLQAKGLLRARTGNPSPLASSGIHVPVTKGPSPLGGGGLEKGGGQEGGGHNQGNLDGGRPHLGPPPVPTRPLPEGGRPLPARSLEGETSAGTASAFWVPIAFIGLLVSDFVLQVLGFSLFHRLVRRIPTRSAAASAARARRIVLSVDKASAFYFKRAWCLQRSAVTAGLLRLAGLPARLVIGARRVPFYAHAWVELDGRVVNDRPAVRQEYEVLETC